MEEEVDADAMQIDIYQEEDTDDNEIPLDKEIEELIRHCEELHVHHHTAIETLQSLHERLRTGFTIQVSRELVEPVEPVDLGDYLEKLHQQTMSDIQEGKSTSFYDVLRDTFEHAIVE